MNDIIQMITRLKHLITQTKDLIPKGGVRDMVLVKNSADDYDYSWSTVSTGVSSYHIDGGTWDSTYLIDQNLNGGGW